MTGCELARQLRKVRGPVFVTMLIPEDVTHVKAVKADLIDWAESIGDANIRMCLSELDGNVHLDIDHSEGA